MFSNVLLAHFRIHPTRPFIVIFLLTVRVLEGFSISFFAAIRIFFVLMQIERNLTNVHPKQESYTSV